MSKNDITAFISTHARISLSDWTVLAKLITDHAKLIKEKNQSAADTEESTLPNILSRREIEDALNGPLQAFFKLAITAYSTLARVQVNLNMLEDDTLKEKRAKLADEDKVPDKILKNTSLADITKIRRALDELVTQQAELWQSSRQQWEHQLLQHLNEQGLSLSEIEVKEFTDPEPISELLDRFTALNIDLPKTSKDDMNFSKYLTLKADIAIQSALSRQHLPHEQSNIQKVLSKIKSDFNAINKQEVNMLAEQKAAINAAVANVSW
ncbi:MAG: hypothetical protein KDH94_01835 [Coxiellaceae bacterium]|nr:hypothetical protein [Coxiellaceae bacterium]